MGMTGWLRGAGEEQLWWSRGQDFGIAFTGPTVGLGEPEVRPKVGQGGTWDLNSFREV